MRSAPRLALPPLLLLLLLLLLLHPKLLLAELLLLLELVAAPGRHDRRDRRKEARLKRTGWLAQRWESVGSGQGGFQGEYGAAGRYATRRRLSPASGASGSSAALLASDPPCQRPQTPC